MTWVLLSSVLVAAGVWHASGSVLGAAITTGVWILGCLALGALLTFDKLN